jgi:heat shock protein HslJ
LPLSAAACGSNSGMTAAPSIAGESQSLLKTSWILVSYGTAAEPKAVIAGSEITAVFGEEPGRVAGSAGCNSYGGGYTTTDGKLTFTPLVSTKKFCGDPPGLMDQEQAYLATLQAAERYLVTGATLEIQATEGRVLRFRERT